jgi:hypothetical protein
MTIMLSAWKKECKKARLVSGQDDSMSWLADEIISALPKQAATRIRCRSFLGTLRAKHPSETRPCPAARPLTIGLKMFQRDELAEPVVPIGSLKVLFISNFVRTAKVDTTTYSTSCQDINFGILTIASRNRLTYAALRLARHRSLKPRQPQRSVTLAQPSEPVYVTWCLISGINLKLSTNLQKSLSRTLAKSPEG